MRPAVPVYWRCTPTLCGALLDVAGLVDLCRPRNYAEAQVGVRVEDAVVVV